MPVRPLRVAASAETARAAATRAAGDLDDDGDRSVAAPSQLEQHPSRSLRPLQ